MYQLWNTETLCQRFRISFNIHRGIDSWHSERLGCVYLEETKVYTHPLRVGDTTEVRTGDRALGINFFVRHSLFFRTRLQSDSSLASARVLNRYTAIPKKKGAPDVQNNSNKVWIAKPVRISFIVGIIKYGISTIPKHAAIGTKGEEKRFCFARRAVHAANKPTGIEVITTETK